jgi:hypothetical protein
VVQAGTVEGGLHVHLRLHVPSSATTASSAGATSQPVTYRE